MKPFLAAMLALLSLAFAAMAYNALFVVHYDVDLVGVLAMLLNMEIPIFGYLSAGVSLAFALAAFLLLRRNTR